MKSIKTSLALWAPRGPLNANHAKAWGIEG